MKGIRFSHWLRGKLPPRIDDPLLILKSVEAENKEAMDAMILGHMRLAMSLVARYNQPNDELVSAALYGLVKAVHHISKGRLKHDNPTGYIVTFIHAEIKRVFKKKSLVPLDETVPLSYPDTTIDLEEKINALNETDRKIVDLLLLGNSQSDIARELNLHRGNVSRRISRIRKELENV